MHFVDLPIPLSKAHIIHCYHLIQVPCIVDTENSRYDLKGLELMKDINENALNSSQRKEKY